MSLEEEYKTAYQREKRARKMAEEIMRQKTHELKLKNDALEDANRKIIQHQKQLVNQEKLAEIGTLAAGVAHEINNPLAFIISNIAIQKQYSLIMQETLASIRNQNDASVSNAIAEVIDRQQASHLNLDYIFEDSPVIFQEIEDGLTRVLDIVSSLKRFSRTKSSDRASTNINETIQAAVKLLQNEIKHKCQLTLDLEPIPEIFCNFNEISQVFLNLIMNAVQAVKDGGEISVNSSYQSHVIIVTVADNGCGIPKENLDKIFMPFFTSKPIGVGTGLGLSVSYGIIRDLGGTIKVDSKVGRGTTFTLLLPVDQRGIPKT